MHAVHDRIQLKGTALYGHYCLYYAYSRCEGMSVQKIVHTMPSPQWIKSCIPILFDIPDIISEYQCCKKNFLKKLCMFYSINVYIYLKIQLFFFWVHTNTLF